jgi:hypothetical protein
MSKNEKIKLPAVIKLLDKNSNIELLNTLDEPILEQIVTIIEENEYNSIVTMENFSDMKKSATKLNGFANDINQFKIAKVKAETEDIEIFKSNCKNYVEIFITKKDVIKKGLAVFEEETKKQVLEVCKTYLVECYEDLKLREEFRSISVLDMTATKYMTAAGNISKPGKDEIIARVNIQNNLQTKVDNRILSLENECLKNNIEPLTVEHIQGFLYADDETYKVKLNSLIVAEISRNERVKEQAKIQAENEAKDKVLREQKALKAELEARYLGRIKTADKGELLIINIELQSYDVAATYELKKLCGDREVKLEKEQETPFDEVEEEYQCQTCNHVTALGNVHDAEDDGDICGTCPACENNTIWYPYKEENTRSNEHLKSIQNEVVKNKTIEKEIVKEKSKPTNGKVLKTLSIKINVPEGATDEQVVSAVIGMIKNDTFPIENIEVN